MTGVESPLVRSAAVKVDGAALPSATLQNLNDVRVELTIDRPSQATLRFFDEDFRLADDATFGIGKAITISFGYTETAMTEVFNGEIVEIAIDQGPTDLHELVLVAYDRGHRLGRSTAAKAFTNVTRSDVVSAIAGDYGLSAQVDASLPANTIPYLLKTVDDAAFLTDVLRRAGAHWRVTGSTLQVFDAATTATNTAKWGETLRRFRTRLNGAVTTPTVAIRGWDPASKQAVVGQAASQDLDLLSDTGGLPTARSDGSSFGTIARTGTRRVVESVDEANVLATALRQEADALNVFARGEVFGDPAMQPANKLQVSGVGTRLGGVYVLTEVEHVFTRFDFVTRFTAGPLAPSSLADLVDTPPLTHLAPVVGLVTGVAHPDGVQGVVKVKFPTFGDAVESAWARVLAPGAGATRGLHLLPSVDDEVLVVFEGGDYRRPVVVGGLWNGVDQPKYSTDTAVASGVAKQWALTSTNGHEIVVDETTSSSEHIAITLADDTTKLYLGKDKVEVVSNSKTLELKSGQASVLLDGASGNITIKGAKITIDAVQQIAITSKQGVDVKAQPGQVNVEGINVALKGSAAVNISSQAATLISGTPVKIN